MEFVGRYAIPAPPDAVWESLTDPEVLKRCIPGCEQISRQSPTEFSATATLKIGPMKARFRGRIALSELDPPRRCVLTGEGQGGVAGFARGTSEVVLTPRDGGTELTYTAKASVGGKLAQIGQRLIDGAAKQFADDFFARFTDTMCATAPALEPDTFGDTRTVASATTAPGDKLRDRISPDLWIVGLVSIVAILLLMLGIAL